MNKLLGYVVNFADSNICTIYADELTISEKMVSFKVKNTIISSIYMSKHHEIKRYNFVDYKLISISHFILQDNKVIETIEAV